ncbi:MAG: hypothetical protein IPP58_08140 [Holophagaceae bacterium]|uniref:Uncharacterized protein n=1 Tax=Candidatus Geothrix skivensis TaxID=2954439 RepID=A0A9D7XGN9_9BACT|nr:hypothetical protein [Candidatus Geothrix skivensis]
MRPQPTFATLSSGVRLHFRVQGAPAGPWLVLLNGLLSDTTLWDGAPSAIERSEEREQATEVACDRGGSPGAPSAIEHSEERERRTRCPARSGGSLGPHSKALP